MRIKKILINNNNRFFEEFINKIINYLLNISIKKSSNIIIKCQFK
jgi:hypothetical protein